TTPRRSRYRARYLRPLERHAEDRPPAVAVEGLDARAHALAVERGEVEAEAGALRRPRGLVADAVEGVEDPRALFARDPRAPVADLEHGGALREDRRDADRLGARHVGVDRRVLARVLDEVRDDGADAVDDDPRARELGRELEHDVARRALRPAADER